MSESAPNPSPLQRLVESNRFQWTIVAVIVLNAITLGLETSASVMSHYGSLLHGLDQLVLGVFVLEISLKLWVYRLGFFRSSWNVFDFIIVAIALVPDSGAFSVLRALRILRVLRLVSVLPDLRKVVMALFSALPGMGGVVALLSLVFYIAAVMVTNLFGEAFPDWFGSIGASMYTLFQIMTLESWSMGIVRPVMAAYPYAWIFFVPFIVVTSFAVLNLFIALIVNSMQALHEAELQEEMAEMRHLAHDETTPVVAELSRLREEVAQLRRDLAQPDD